MEVMFTGKAGKPSLRDLNIVSQIQVDKYQVNESVQT